MCCDNCNDGVEFDPKKYLDTYYTEVDDENAQLLAFWDTMHPLVKDAEILEIGCGPTIFTAIPLAWRAKHMVLTDALQYNLDEIEKWKNYKDDAFDWSPTIDFYLDHSRHGLREVFITQTNFANLIDHRISTELFDIHKHTLDKGYDAIVTSFCLAEACDCWEDFASILHELIQHLNPHGTFGLVTAISSHKYTIGETVVPMTSINVDRLYGMFISHFDEVHLKLIPIDMDRGYNKIAAIWGRD